jgi:hypothetical protein
VLVILLHTSASPALMAELVERHTPSSTPSSSSNEGALSDGNKELPAGAVAAASATSSAALRSLLNKLSEEWMQSSKIVTASAPLSTPTAAAGPALHVAAAAAAAAAPLARRKSASSQGTGSAMNNALSSKGHLILLLPLCLDLLLCDSAPNLKAVVTTLIK